MPDRNKPKAKARKKVKNLGRVNKKSTPRPLSRKLTKGRAKKGSGKMRLIREGGTKRDLNTWRSLSPGTRKTIKRSMKSHGPRYSLRKTLQNMRRGSTFRGMGRGNPTPRR